MSILLVAEHDNRSLKDATHKALTAAQALAALREGIETTSEPGETVAEAQAEIGVADWVDPDTGEPAEDVVTRIEEH